jgi:hypothetical protein
MLMISLVSFLVATLSMTVAAPLSEPTVHLDDATITGTSAGRTSSFLGIPFAQPP